MVLAMYGMGGAGKAALHTVEDVQKEYKRWDEVVLIDDTKPIGEFCGFRHYPYSEFMTRYNPKIARVNVAIGELSSREMLIRKVKQDGYSLESIIHPHAHISHDAILAEGVTVKVGCYIGKHAKIGVGSTVYAYASVGDRTVIGDCSQISAGATIGADVHIGDNVFVGMNAVISDQATIKQGAIIAMGAVAFGNVGQDLVCSGNPGRALLSCAGSHRVFK